MGQFRVPRWALCVVVAAALLPLAATPLRLHFPHGEVHTPSPALADYGALPLSFEPNAGQVDPAVRFSARAPGAKVYFTASDVVLSMAQPEVPARGRGPLSKSPPSTPAAPSVLRMSFVGANPASSVVPGSSLPGKVNYLRGADPKGWITDVPTYRGISYSGLYPGVDLSYEGARGQLKSTYTVAPGADPRAIRWRYQGASAVDLDKSGNLKVKLAPHARGGASAAAAPVITEEAPVVWQDFGGRRRMVPTHYDIGADDTVGFRVGAYDRTKDLVIDPTLSYSTFLGGLFEDSALDIAVDSAGSAYVTGYTSSPDFPTTLGAQQMASTACLNTCAASSPPFAPIDAFVTKLNPAGSALVYSTYLGGEQLDTGRSIAVDAAGNAFVAGFTTSTLFPMKNPVQSSMKGGTDAFVAKLNPTGSALVYSTYLGGMYDETASAIAVGADHSAYIVGVTASPDFPTRNAVQPAKSANEDTFVSRLNPTGSALVYSTFLGGSTQDYGGDVAVGADGSAYVVGSTHATNFPTTATADQPVKGAGGSRDAFVTKLNPTGSALAYSTYLGGAGDDLGVGVAVDAAGDAYVAGTTTGAFPTQSPVQGTYGGSGDAFVATFRPSGERAFSTYLGGSGSDDAAAIAAATDGSGSAYVTGRTASTNFPTAGASPAQPALKGGVDAFVAKVTGAVPPPPAPPTVVSTSPSSRVQGASAQNITVTGTDFASGATVSFAGSGISVRTTTVVGATTLRVNISVAADASTGGRNVTVTNPGGAAGTCSGCFAVTAAPPPDPAAPVVSTVAWGANTSGQLGVPNPPSENSRAAAVEDLPGNIVAVSAGPGHSLALTSNGRVYAWGNNENGELGRGTVSASGPPALVGSDAAPFADVVAVAAGNGHSLALKSDGTVWAWGANGRGQLGNGQPNNGFVPVNQSSPVRVLIQSPVTAISAGGEHSLALTSAGGVYFWGEGPAGSSALPVLTGVRLNSVNHPVPEPVPDLTGGVQAIAAGGAHDLVLKSDGTVWARGSNSYGQLGDDSADLAARAAVAPVVGLNDPSHKVVSIAAGDRHSLAVKSDGSVVAWGYNTGDGDAPRNPNPVPVRGLIGVTRVAAGSTHSLALEQDGSLWAWGSDRHHALGLGPQGSATKVALQVVGMHAGVVAMGAGGEFSVATQLPQPAPTLPAAPSGVTAGGQNGRAVVTWIAPSSDGGQPISHYRVTTLPDRTTTTVAGAVLTATVTGLTNGQAYTFTVAAENAEGFSPESVPSPVAVPGPLFVTAVSPGSGPSGGGDTVRIDGAGFAAATKVSFGDVDAPSFRVVDESQISAVTPSHVEGSVDVTVSSASLVSSVTPASRYTFNPPKLTGLKPSAGPSRGSTSVVITGEDLSDVRSVTFGGLPAVSFSPDSPTQITALSPAQNVSEPVPVVVTTGRGASVPASVGVNRFLYFDGDWHPTGSLQQPRTGHTLTLLDRGKCGTRCGKVLAAGGGWTAASGQQTSVAAAELYDRASGTWSLTGALQQPRFGHTATLLPDGRVLVTGGVASADPSAKPPSRNVLKSAELYDPSTGTWVRAADMGVARDRHTASLLADGRVLVVGGYTKVNIHLGATVNPPRVSSSEIYDPVADTWTPTPAMFHDRFDHTATTLRDGRVLVVGGQAAGNDPADVDTNAEVFDPTAAGGKGAWAPTGSLYQGHREHAATLLPSGKVLVRGDGEAEVYDPAATGVNGLRGQWALTSRTSQRHRAEHTATVMSGGRVVVAGGLDSALETDGTEVYDPDTSAWFSLAPMTVARRGAAAVELPATDGLPAGVLMVGGTGSADNPGDLDLSELFDSDPDGLPTIASVDPPAGRSGHETRVTITGTALFPTLSVHIGGRPVSIESSSYKRLVVVVPARLQGVFDVVVTTPVGRSQPAAFTSGAGVWTPTGRFAGVTPGGAGQPQPYGGRYLHEAVLLDPPICHQPSPPSDYPCGKVLAVGGTAGLLSTKSALSLAELYDPATGRWELTTSMSGGARVDYTATLLANGKVLVAGGIDPSTLRGRDTAEVYDPQTKKWEATRNNMSVGRQSHTATLLRDGRVLVAGGATDEASRDALALTELYDPQTNLWTPAAPMNEPRELHTATLLTNGDVLVTGGMLSENPGEEAGLLTRAHTTLASVEIFHLDTGAPGNGSWTTTSPLGVARYRQTATLLDQAPCGKVCGRVVVVGGYAAGQNATGLASAELLDPVTRTWTLTGLPRTPRGGHTATILDDGKVLVAGRGYPFPDPFRHPLTPYVELYDPVTETWTQTGGLAQERGLHTATLLDGPACRAASPPPYCHSVLVAGGAIGQASFQAGIDSAELYTSVPRVAALLPATGPSLGGAEVSITGTGFLPTSTVSFGGLPAQAVVFESTTRLRAVAPRHPPGKVEIAVTNDSGSSGHDRPRLDVPFTYDSSAVPNQVQSLVATSVSDSKIVLSFAAPPDDSQFPMEAPPAQRYVVKQSLTPFSDDTSFDSAPSICPTVGCAFSPAEVGTVLSLDVKDLEASTTYHYAVAAMNDIGQGPVSTSASATTLDAASLAGGCPAPAVSGVGQLSYPGRRYAMVGLPEGTLVPADSPLYSWLDLGAGGNYSAANAPAPVTAGHGYWAWFRCPKVIDLAPGTARVSLPLGEYHASMVGNPATSPATVTGHDFAARWDPALNDGVGGYRISGYREPQTLAVGEGTWVFSYVRTEVRIEASG